MARPGRRRMLREDVVAPALVLAVVLGGWWTGAQLIGRFWSPRDSVAESRVEPVTIEPPPSAAVPSQQLPSPTSPAGPAVSPDDVDILRARRLRIPVEGVEQTTLTSSFHQARATGGHEAMDIMASRGTAVVAVEAGRIAKLLTNEKGGLTVYQLDASESFCYYYAHLDRYSPALEEDQVVSAGEVIGYVGSTGNASPDAPHLHFAIFRLGPERRWWQGLPIDPYLVLR